jgi:hypothetical protein
MNFPALGLVGALKPFHPLALGLLPHLGVTRVIDQGTLRQFPEVAAESASLAVELEGGKRLQQPYKDVLKHIIRGVLLEPQPPQVSHEQRLIKLVKLTPTGDIGPIANACDQRNVGSEFRFVVVSSIGARHD